MNLTQDEGELADPVVKLEVDRLHLPGDGQAGVEKNELKPWRKKEWRIPKVSAEFVARMEDVLDLYERVRSLHGGRAGPLCGTL